MIEYGMWAVILMAVAYSGYRVGHMFVDADALAELDMLKVELERQNNLLTATTDELLELQEEYQRLYRQQASPDDDLWAAMRDGLPELGDEGP